MAASEFAARRNLLAYNLVEHDLDALVVSFGPNVRYLTGYTGSNGLVARMTRNPGDAGEESLPALLTGVEFKTGDLLRIETPSSAGYGDPLERDPQQVAEDFLDGYFDIAEALQSYGVVLSAAGAETTSVLAVEVLGVKAAALVGMKFAV